MQNIPLKYQFLCCFFFFITLDLLLPKFCPKDHTHFKVGKTSENCFFGSNLHRKEVIMGHAQDGQFFFGRNNKIRSSAFRKFLFYQNIICFD